MGERKLDAKLRAFTAQSSTNQLIAEQSICSCSRTYHRTPLLPATTMVV